MNSLTLEHIAPYLIYGIKCRTKIGDLYLNELCTEGDLKAWFVYNSPHKRDIFVKYNSENVTVKDGSCARGFRLKNITPILRPLSDLTKEIEHNGDKFVPYQRMYDFASNLGINKGAFEYMLNSILDGQTYITELPYYLVQKLISWHFDVFGLIDKGLAIDINTI